LGPFKIFYEEGVQDIFFDGAYNIYVSPYRKLLPGFAFLLKRIKKTWKCMDSETKLNFLTGSLCF
jgi:hypothetical protein